jgi:hypothetical protein
MDRPTERYVSPGLRRLDQTLILLHLGERSCDMPTNASRHHTCKSTQVARSWPQKGQDLSPKSLSEGMYDSLSGTRHCITAQKAPVPSQFVAFFFHVVQDACACETRANLVLPHPRDFHILVTSDSSHDSDSRCSPWTTQELELRALRQRDPNLPRDLPRKDAVSR